MNLTKHLLKSNRNCVAKNRVKTILVSAHQSAMEAPDLSQNLGAMMLSQNRWHNQCISMAGVWFVMVSLFWNLWFCTNCRHCFALAFPAWRCLTSGRFTQQATCRRAAWKAARKPQTACHRVGYGSYCFPLPKSGLRERSSKTDAAIIYGVHTSILNELTQGLLCPDVGWLKIVKSHFG